MQAFLPVLAAAALVAAAIALLPSVPRRKLLLLPPGVTEVRSEILVEGATEVCGAASGSVLRAAPGFSGRALIVVRGGGVLLRDFAIDGNRAALETRSGLPPSNVPFARFTRGNGVLAEGVSDLSIERVRFREIAGFAVLASGSRQVTVEAVQVIASGSRNAAGRNNTTGGIVFEEGSSGFRVSACVFRDIRGNGLWTHSLYTSPRNARGWLARNRFENIGRDAIQVGHATDVRVEENSGLRIGFPAADVDIENLAVPVGIDTAGNVERCTYAGNHFREINGKCIDLDGFHDGEIRGNVCTGLGNFGIVMNDSNPDMQSRNIRILDNLVDGAAFGGIFVIGTGHWIARNRLLNLNTSHHPSEPDILRSGIYLGEGAERPAPARGNVIERNEITGFEMDRRCIGLAPGIQPGWNTVHANVCRAQ